MSEKNMKGYFAFKHAATAFEEFINSQAFGGILLIIVTIISLSFANSPYIEHYIKINHSLIGFHFNALSIEKSLQHWVNDGLMAIFFLLVGLEIKREMLMGELRSFDKASLPIFAAIGGMIIPALIFYLINMHNPATLRGWAIPTATDIAYAIGILSLLSRRIPRSLVVMLSAIAIADDLGAVTVIAVFYNQHILIYYLLISLLCFTLLIALNRAGIKVLSPYLFIGVVMWYTMLQSGVHATIAGVLLAFTIPGKLNYTPTSVLNNVKNLILRFEQLVHPNDIERTEHKKILNEVEMLSDEVSTPLRRLEYMLHTPVTLFILPLFAFLNAGVQFHNVTVHSILTNQLIIGIAIALVLGKIIGIFGTIYFLIKFKFTTLPTNMGLNHVFGLSLIAGIGFTMSIFITELAFPGQSVILNDAKIGIFIGSIIAGAFGFVYLRMISKPTH